MADDLQEYEVAVGVCGGIAAYKVCSVISDLVQRGAGVLVGLDTYGRSFYRQGQGCSQYLHHIDAGTGDRVGHLHSSNLGRNIGGGSDCKVLVKSHLLVRPARLFNSASV